MATQDRRNSLDWWIIDANYTFYHGFETRKEAEQEIRDYYRHLVGAKYTVEYVPMPKETR